MQQPPPDLDPDAVLAALRRAYGVRASALEFLPVGEASWCYRAGDAFVRVPRVPPRDATLAVAAELAASLPLVAPLRASDGAYGVDVAGRRCVVYPWIAGESAMRASVSRAERASVRREIGRIVGRLHATRISSAHERALPRARWDAHQRALARVLAARHPQIDAHGPTLARLLDASRRSAREQRRRPFAPVIAHGDAHEDNVLIDRDGATWLVDVDGLALAPRERDLYFFGPYGANGDRRPFLAGYAEVHGDFESDALRLEHYALEWAVQEVADYGTRLLDASLDRAARDDAGRRFDALFADGGDVARIAPLVRAADRGSLR